jgi:hypothetical protein
MIAHSGTPDRQGTPPVGEGRPPGSAYGRATPDLRPTPATLILIDAGNHPDCRCAIERTFCRIKDFRGIATRFDKTARNFLAAVCLISAITYWA